MARRKRTLEEKLTQDVERIFDEKLHQMGISKVRLQVNVATGIWGPPIVGENVYAEAFPFESPPRIWIQVWPDATDKEIAKTVYHELLHIKHPELDEKSVEKRAPTHMRLRGARMR